VRSNSEAKVPLLEIIAVTYGHGFKLKCFIDSIRAQTEPNWRLHVIHDGGGKAFDSLKKDLLKNGYLSDSRVVLSRTRIRSNDWGHSLREYGLQNRISNAQYITITNCDNYYVPIWVSEIEKLAKLQRGFIYWDCVHDDKNENFDRPHGYGLLNSRLKHRWIDMGCAAIKSDIAAQVGFPFRDFAADWKFFEACLKYTCDPITKLHNIQKIPKILFVHN